MPASAQHIFSLLTELEQLLRAQGETNWLRGVEAARSAIARPEGFDDAKSIYKTMCQGNGSFSDYNVWHEDFEARRKLNEPLDRLRGDLWDAFGL